MCCFSRPVVSVSATKIFARPARDGRQFLVYSMTLDAKEDLAMILPLPVKKDAGEKDVEFINLKDYANFFTDLQKGFPAPASESTRGPVAAAATPTKSLEVHEVGEFQASFVPTVKDFTRLDERFRLPPKTWDQLPQYQSYGFAVFKLKPGAKTIHPMAFSFSRNQTKKLFFPTVHIHDGKVHERAEFDHVLYAQPRLGESIDFSGWQESSSPANNFMQIKKGQGLLAGTEHCYKRELTGELRNDDTWLKGLS